MLEAQEAVRKTERLDPLIERLQEAHAKRLESNDFTAMVREAFHPKGKR